MQGRRASRPVDHTPPAPTVGPTLGKQQRGKARRVLLRHPEVLWPRRRRQRRARHPLGDRGVERHLLAEGAARGGRLLAARSPDRVYRSPRARGALGFTSRFSSLPRARGREKRVDLSLPFITPLALAHTRPHPAPAGSGDGPAPDPALDLPQDLKPNTKSVVEAVETKEVAAGHVSRAVQIEDRLMPRAGGGGGGGDSGG
jgi:hypothetical protein